MTKIYLIGMPGSGKTTLGKEVAAALGISFVDLDKEIERSEQQTISDIFSKRGEPYFRQVESLLLQEWAASQEEMVMATGGGAPCFHQGMNVINRSGISVFLDVPVDVLVERTQNKSTRPLLLAEDEIQLRKKLEMLRGSRLIYYQQAHVTLRNADVATVLKALRPKIKM